MNKPLLRMVGAILAITALPAVAQMVPVYDNFSSGTLSPSKWIGVPICTLPSTLECVRAIQRGKLEMRAVTHGINATDAGASYDSSYVKFANPTTVHGVDFRVTIPDTTAVGCANNPSPADAAFAVSGTFFNTGSGVWTEDVQATVLVGRTASANSALYAVAFLSIGYVNFFGNVGLGYVTPGETVRVTLRWDAPGSQFIMSLTHPGQAPIIASIPYSQANALPPAIPQVIMGVRNFAPSCIGSPTVAGMTALVDNVFVNSPRTP